MVHVPPVTIVTVLPLTAHTVVVLDENVTANLEEAAALTVNGGLP
jgi:hypothetical protein